MARVKKSERDKDDPASASFAAALSSSRRELADRLEVALTAKCMAERLLISVARYQSFERGTAPSRYDLDRICTCYLPFDDLVSALQDAYDRSFGKSAKAVVPFHAENHKREPWLQNQSSSILSAYESRDVNLALTLSRNSWAYALNHCRGLEAFNAYSRLVARAASQFDDHSFALHVVGESLTVSIENRDMFGRNHLLHSNIAYRNRSLNLRGAAAARPFLELAKELQSGSAGHKSSRFDREARVPINFAYRSAVIAITESYDGDGEDMLKNLREDLFESAKSISDPTIVHASMLALLRIDATIRGNVDQVLSIDENAELTYSDKAFMARSKIFAMHRAGKSDEAFELCRKWERECAKRRMHQKAATFKRLGSAIRPDG